MKLWMSSAIAALALLGALETRVHAAGSGTGDGGGGDASEVQVNAIRSDLVEWIRDGGSKKLVFPPGVSVKDYDERMAEILAPQAVVIGFVEDNSSPDEELQVIVDGQPKTCRGFISKKDQKPHLLCNIARFNATRESDQYVLIHHEYAGLAGVEVNSGAASDYSISSQITEFLVEKKVYRLSVKVPFGGTLRVKNSEIYLTLKCMERSSEGDCIKVRLDSNACPSDYGSGQFSLTDANIKSIAYSALHQKKMSVRHRYLRAGDFPGRTADSAMNKIFGDRISAARVAVAIPVAIAAIASTALELPFVSAAEAVAQRHGKKAIKKYLQYIWDPVLKNREVNASEEDIRAVYWAIRNFRGE